MVKIQHAGMICIPTTCTFSTFILNRFLFKYPTTLSYCCDQIFSPICICPFFDTLNYTHIVYGIALQCNRQATSLDVEKAV